MAEAIGSVRATFTASAGGMIGAIDQIVGKLGGFAAAQKRTLAQTSDYNSVLAKMTNQFATGGLSADDLSTRVGNIQRKFAANVPEGERLAAALAALRNGSMMAGASAEELATAEAKMTAAVKAATPPIERLSIDLAKNRADFLAGKISVDQYRQTIATLPGQINGTETAAAKMDRVFKQGQETMRGLVTPADQFEQRLRQLNEQLQAGVIDDRAYAASLSQAAEKLNGMTPASVRAAQAIAGLKRQVKEGTLTTAEYAAEVGRIMKGDIRTNISVQVVGVRQGIEATAELRDAIQKLTGKQVEAAVAVSGAGSLESLRSQLNGINGKQVDAIFKAVGVSTLEDARATLDALGADNQTVTATLRTVGLDSVEQAKQVLDGLQGKNVTATAQALGAENIEQLVQIINAVESKTVSVDAKADASDIVNLERAFAAAQKAIRDNAGPTAELESELANLTAAVNAGYLSEEQFAVSSEKLRAKIAALSPEGIAAAKAAEELAKAMERGKAVTEQFLTPQEKFAATMAELDTLLAQGAVKEDTFARAAAAAKEKLTQEEEALRAATPEAKALSEAMAEGKQVTEAMLSPTEKYEQELKKLDGLLAKGAISEETYARATKKAKEELDRATPAAKSLGDAFGGMPGPIGAAARALDVMSKSLASTAGGFKGGIGAGISNFVGQLKSGIANAGSTGGASLVGIAPQIGLIAGAGFAAVRGLQALTGALASVGAEVERTEQLATRLGVSFQEYEILKVAAANAGVEVEALASAQTKGLKAISEARGGAEEQAKAFEALGVSQEELANSNPNQLLEQVAKKLSAIEDPATRAALTMKIFGKSGNDVLPALSGIDQVRAGIDRLGGTMRAVDVSRFSQMDDSFDNLGVAAGRLKTTLLAPFTELFSRVSNGLAAVTGGLSKAFAPIGNLLAEIGGAIGFVVERLGESLGFALRIVGAFAEMSGITVIASAIGAAVEQWSRGFEAVDSFMEPLVSGLEQVASFISDKIGRSITAIYTIFGNLVASSVEWVSQSSLLSGLFEGLGGAAQIVYDAFVGIGGWVEYVVQQLEYWAGIEPKPKTSRADAEAIEEQMKAREEEAKAAKEAAKQAEQDAKNEKKRAEDRAKQIKDGLLSPYEKMQQQIAEINDLEQKGLLTAEQRAAQEAKIRDEFAAQDPLAKQAKKTAEEQTKAAEDISKEIEKSTKAGADLVAAADPIRAAFQQTAEAIKSQVEKGIISPEDAKKQMGDAVDAMNEELKRLGEDQKFAEKIRDGFKTAADKAKEELDAIDKNQTLTAEEKDKAKQQVRDKFASGLPGEQQKDAADKFLEDQKKLKEALDKGLIDPKQFRERQAAIREELESSVADLKDKQERNQGPDRRAVSATDVNSSAGASTFFRLLRGQDEPTRRQLEEAKRQTRLLERIAAVEKQVVKI